jgi:hypothetical protein
VLLLVVGVPPTLQAVAVQRTRDAEKLKSCAKERALQQILQTLDG